MTRKLALNETETTLTIEATNRSVVHIYSADPVYQRKLERVGATMVRDCIDGGKFFTLPANQLRITKPPRKLSDAEKEAARARMEIMRAAQANA